MPATQSPSASPTLLLESDSPLAAALREWTDEGRSEPGDQRAPHARWAAARPAGAAVSLSNADVSPVVFQELEVVPIAAAGLPCAPAAGPRVVAPPAPPAREVPARAAPAQKRPERIAPARRPSRRWGRAIAAAMLFAGIGTFAVAAGSRARLVLGREDVKVRITRLLPAARESNVAVMSGGTGTPTAMGRLRVSSRPEGTVVIVDGRERGLTPLTIDDLQPGNHVVKLTSAAGSVRRSIHVKGNQTETLDVPIYPGWLAVFSPIELELSARGRALWLDEQHQVMLSPGIHEVRVTNSTLAYRDSRVVEITPGEITAVRIIPPKTVASVIARPPAEVWVDGRPVGYSPLADVGVDIGTREFVFRHPSFGERHHIVTATAAPLHVEVDLAALPR